MNSDGASRIQGNFAFETMDSPAALSCHGTPSTVAHGVPEHFHDGSKASRAKKRRPAQRGETRNRQTSWELGSAPLARAILQQASTCSGEETASATRCNKQSPDKLGDRLGPTGTSHLAPRGHMQRTETRPTLPRRAAVAAAV